MTNLTKVFLTTIILVLIINLGSNGSVNPILSTQSQFNVEVLPESQKIISRLEDPKDYSIDQKLPFEFVEKPNDTLFVYGQPNAIVTWKFNQSINVSAGFLFEDLHESNNSTLILYEYLGFVREVSFEINWSILIETVEMRKNTTLYLTIHMDDVQLSITDSTVIGIIPDTFAPQILQYSVLEEFVVNETVYFEFDVYDHNIPQLSQILLNNNSVENIEHQNRTVFNTDLDEMHSFIFQQIIIGVHLEELGEFNLTVIFEDTYRNNGSLTITGSTISGNTANYDDETSDSDPGNLIQDEFESTSDLNLPINIFAIIMSILLLSTFKPVLRQNDHI